MTAALAAAGAVSWAVGQGRREMDGEEERPKDEPIRRRRRRAAEAGVKSVDGVLPGRGPSPGCRRY